MNSLISKQNFENILIGIRQKILEDIDNKDMTDEQKAILNKVDSLLINGDGLKILTDNGTYKDCNSEELNQAILNTDTVWDLFNININPIAEKWESRTVMPSARYSLTSQMHDAKIYVIGGHNELINQCYDISSNTWSSKTSMNVTMYDVVSAIYKNRIYCAKGGMTYYDIDTNTWTSVAGMPTSDPYSSSLLTYKEKLYYIGYNTQCYDIATNTWSSKTSMPNIRNELTSSIYQDKIYTIGGYNSNLNECYNITTDTWSSKANVPTGYGQATSNVYKNKIYVIGGEGGLNRNECYDIDTNTWSSKLKMITGRRALTSSIYQDKIFTIGGISDKSTNENECYTVEHDVTTYTIELPSSIQDKLDVVNKDGDGTKVLSDNGSYVDIPTLYRYMNDEEVQTMIKNITV